MIVLSIDASGTTNFSGLTNHLPCTLQFEQAAFKVYSVPFELY